MRTIPILLLLCACVGADLFKDSELKNKAMAPIGGKIREHWRNFLKDMKQHFESKFFDFRKKLEKFKGKIKERLTLTKKQLAEVARRLKEVRRTIVNQIKRQGDTIEQINWKNGAAKKLFQSDIVLTREQALQILKELDSDGSRSKRQAYRGHSYPQMIWPDAKVPFLFAPNTSERAKRVFRKAAKLWSDKTCIDIFEDSNATEAIRVIGEGGCSSTIGKYKGLQNLTLGKNCEAIGIAAHELGHALGFFHTHARHDRDQSITVLPQNIRQDWLDQFTAQTTATNDNYGLPYDYGSIMHYGATSGTNSNSRPLTMIPINQKYLETMGSPFISFIDFLMMNTHYNCTAKCDPQTSAKCDNHGFPHPRDCTKCICPFGYGGRYCKKKPASCGKVLNATEKEQEFTDVVGNKSAGVSAREEFAICYYWIKAPEGKKIRVQLTEFKPEGIAVDGCAYGGVEFKAQADQRLTGMRYCSKQDEGTVLISESNLMPIITYNRIYESTVTVKYRFI
ncbi:hypothetical protein Q1695_002253 [Nippostrongylus brasiliensis]|nr:hypothetical protein Q1695_002253 [Nippostrongylus brasiliensis]